MSYLPNMTKKKFRIDLPMLLCRSATRKRDMHRGGCSTSRNRCCRSGAKGSESQTPVAKIGLMSLLDFDVQYEYML